MNTEERLEHAHELIKQAKDHLVHGWSSPDPVAERREFAQAATKLRAAADVLDDQGRLQE